MKYPARIYYTEATRMFQYGVAVLEKDLPFPAHCALSWSIRVALIPQLSP